MKINEIINESNINEGILQSTLNYLWKVSSKALDNAPVIGPSRERKRIEAERDNFINTMTPSKIESWLTALADDLKSNHPATKKANERHQKTLSWQINNVIKSKSHEQFQQNMKSLNGALRDYKNYIKKSNKGHDTRVNKA